MHPVVPQPGTRTHSVVTANSQNIQQNQGDQSQPVQTKGPASNLDLLAGLDLDALSISPTPPVIKTLPTFQNKQHQSSISPETIKMPHVDCRAVKKPMFVLETEQLTQETEKLQSLVSGLGQRTLQGTLPLDSLWREVVESVEKSATKLSVSVARCYPMKNRASDVLPFDQSRVELKEKKVLNLFL